MSAANDINFGSERWSVEQILRTRQQGKPFLSSRLEVYLDVGDFVEFKDTATGEGSQIGLILDVASHDPSDGLSHAFLEDQMESTRWVQVNLWVLSHQQTAYQAEPSTAHVNLPSECIRTTNVKWVPETYICDVSFIFHIIDILHGRYPNTKGLKNVFFCRSLLDETQNSTIPHPYYPIFHSNRVESYPDRVWGVIEKIQSMFHKVMGRRGDSQKLNYSESVNMSIREWIIIKRRFEQQDFCHFSHTGNSTSYRYGKNLSKETIKQSKVSKQVISVENSNMLNQLIRAFGTCVCSTVRSRWPCGRKISRGDTRSHAVQNLQKKKYINSVIGLSLIDTPNAEIEYVYRKKTIGVDFRYDPSLKKFTLAVRYAKIDSGDDIIRSFYSNIVLEENQEVSVEPPIIGNDFEAHDCLFTVRRVNGNNAICRVSESGNDQYLYGIDYSLNLDFVRLKINEYLEES